MWLLSDYEAVTLFSLRPSAATASGGKTLLVPTPYAIKMALLDVACRVFGVATAQRLWPEIRDLRVALRPANSVVVTNLFQKMLRPRRSAAAQGSADAGPFQKSIGYREYAQLIGALGVALGWLETTPREWIAVLLLNLNYLGKRGGFVQLLAPPVPVEDLPTGFVEVTCNQAEFVASGTLQILDDCSPTLTFDQVNIYSRCKMALGKDRLTRHIVLPYRMARSSKSFTVYERIV